MTQVDFSCFCALSCLYVDRLRKLIFKNNNNNNNSRMSGHHRGADHPNLQENLEAHIEKLEMKYKLLSVKRDWRLYYEIAVRVNLPSNFILPEMEKFDGTGDPFIHLEMFKHTMDIYQLGEDVMITLFPIYLTKSALAWFYHPNVQTFTTFQSIADSFSKRYSFNTVDDIINLRLLKNTKQESNETFSEYAVRWKKQMLLLVIDMPDEKKLISMFFKSLQKKYRLTDFVLYESFELLIEAGMNLERLSIEKEEEEEVEVENVKHCEEEERLSIEKEEEEEEVENVKHCEEEERLSIEKEEEEEELENVKHCEKEEPGNVNGEFWWNYDEKKEETGNVEWGCYYYEKD
ncbi:gametocyte surface protein P230-like [Impatiens glandulifera]|uniref:gametocyte surface protein P230-like n=1 Tax=Impatiens glandulifera TaxID=253017 RepID=UPI001FB0A4EB|nr:gametocyte surface protein P230-like [Impatiens glandulifera]